MKNPPRFVIPDTTNGRATGDTVRVTGSELHHMRNVMRLRAGSDIVLCGAHGRQYTGRVAGYEPNAAIVTVAGVDCQRSGVPALILAAGMIKAARMDFLVEKASELDAAEFWLLNCARSVMREPSSGRRERWRRIALAAAKQSQRSNTMEIHDPVDVAGFVDKVPTAAFAVTCMAGAQPLSAVIHRKGNGLRGCRAVVLAIGPEGDFTAEEIALMRDAGFAAAELGRNRLRSETAALAALSITTGVLAELLDAGRRF